MPKKEKEKLPPGWLKRESKTYPGNFYYFHKQTKKTTWQLPTNEEITKTESKESKPSSVSASKTPAKTQRKSLDVKEKQESMIPRAVRQISTPSSSVRGQKRILNVSVLNRNNCNLVADYSSSSDGEQKESKSKKKKNENKNKTKKNNLTLPSLAERKKVQMKWKPVGPSISQPSSKLVVRKEQDATKSKDITYSPIPPKVTKSPQKTVKLKKKSTSKVKKKKILPSESAHESQESKKPCLDVPLKKKSKKVPLKDDKPKKTVKKIVKKTVKKNLTKEEVTNEKSLEIKPRLSKKVVKKKTGRKIKNINNSANGKEDVDQNKQNNAFPHAPVISSEQFLSVAPEINASDLIRVFGENNTSFNNQNISTSSSFQFSDNYLEQIEDFSQPMEVDSCPDSDMIDYIVKIRRDMSNERFSTATGDLTKNFQIDTSSSSNVVPSQPQLTYVVLDTSALVNAGDLVLLKNICDGRHTADGHLPNIVIPWVVMQELDVLKSRSKQKQKVAERAQQAIVFLWSFFSRKHPRVIGQTLKEAMQVNNYLVAENNDDKILQCCMQLESKHPQCKIILYSNDVNLCNKSMINGIVAYNKFAICSGLSTLTGSSIENCDNDKSPPPTKLTPPQLNLATQIVTRLKDTLKRVFGLVLETEMIAAFGDMWLKIIKVQPPWELKDILYCYVEHWYAVFGQIYTDRHLMENMYKKLLKRFSSDRAFKQPLEVLSSEMDECILVLQPLLSMNPVYKDEIKSCVKSIEIFQQICTAIGDEKVDLNSNLDELLQQQKIGVQEERTESSFSTETESSFSTEFSMNIALTKFQEVWEIFNSYCQEVERTLQSGASRETYQRVLTALQTSVPMMEIIYNQFFGCIGISVTDILQESNMFTVLAEQLNTILPHLGCHVYLVELGNMPVITGNLTGTLNGTLYLTHGSSTLLFGQVADYDRHIPEFDKRHLKKVGGYIDRNVVQKTTKDSSPLVNCGHLQTLFSNTEKREMLSNGLAQLERMIRGLHTYKGNLIGT